MSAGCDRCKGHLARPDPYFRPYQYASLRTTIEPDMPLDVLTIGDPTIDTFLKIHEAYLALQVDPGRTELCIDYADKIPVDEYHRLVAGGCVNVAVSLARLGVKTGVYGLTGADAEGATIRVALEAERVDSSLIAVDSKRGTNASTALVFRGERTLFVWHQVRRYRLPSTPDVRWIYLSSVGPPGPDVDRLHADVCASLAASGAELAFGPGTHQLRMGARALSGLLQRTRLLLLNRREGAELADCPDRSPKKVLAALRDLGPQIVVMTDGPKGSYAYDGEQFLSSGILNAPIVDRTGAGDAYGSSVLAALILGRPLAEAMAWGTVQASHVVSVFGATPGLVRRAQLLAELAEHPELTAQVI